LPDQLPGGLIAAHSGTTEPVCEEIGGKLLTESFFVAADISLERSRPWPAV
jgi:hypothetical protein